MSANAAPFVPRAKTLASSAPLASTLMHNRPAYSTIDMPTADTSIAETSDTSRLEWMECFCPYFEVDGRCPEPSCALVHGDKCEMCDRYILHPTDADLCKEHHDACLAEHLRAMEIAFATQRSVTQQCNICMDNVHQESQRFGILNNCKHCFCLRCIRQWRKSTDSSNPSNRKATRCACYNKHNFLYVRVKLADPAQCVAYPATLSSHPSFGLRATRRSKH